MTQLWTLFLNRVYYPFVKYRIHISLIFLFLIINVYGKILSEEVVWPVAIGFFIWHLALYLFDRAYDFDKDAVSQPEEAMSAEEQYHFVIFSVLLSVVPLFIFAYYSLPVWPYLFFIPITFLYTYPVYKGKRAKNVLFFKNFYSAFLIWTLPLVVIAVWYSQQTQLNFIDLYKNHFLGLFFYVLIGEAFWDIRDIEGDRQAKVNTLPIMIGIGPTKVYLYALILIDFAYFGRMITDSTIIYLILITIVNRKTPNWVYHLPPLLALYRFLKPLFLN